MGHFKSLGRRPKGGDFLQLRLQRYTAKFLFRFHTANLTGPVGHWLSM
jgi:hypothetical protein